MAPPVPSSSGFNWRWPADGDLIGRYVAGDPTKQGVDIAGNGGAAVRAAADGVVVYSGSGWWVMASWSSSSTASSGCRRYGHNRSRLVNEGQLVKAGDQIAEMGRSGAARDMLHFEVRYNGKPSIRCCTCPGDEPGRGRARTPQVHAASGSSVVRCSAARSARVVP
jgi:lipoprotein NlpD